MLRLSSSLLAFLLFSIFSSAYSVSPATDKKAMVVTAHHLATQVGVDILSQGGNAVDAAVGIGYALAVVYPCCGNLGGGGFMLIHFANGKDTFINFREKAPDRISPALFLDSKGNVKSELLSSGHAQGKAGSYLAVGVPGTVMGLNTALKEYGSLPLKKVIAPAIRLAEEGFILKSNDAKLFQLASNSFKSQKNVAEIFLHDGESYQEGDRLIQRNLAKTLNLIAKAGNDAFYRGPITNEIVYASQNHHGVLTKQDFKAYTIQETQPLYCNYRGYTVITTPPPGGGVILCEMLNIVEGFPLSKMGFHTATSINATTQAMRFAFKDRNKFLGDPDFVTIPLEHLLSKKYAEQIRQNIPRENATKEYIQDNEGKSTTSYVVVDQDGNVVSVTYTINNYFGARLIAGNTGFFLNNEMDDFAIKSNTPNNFGLIQGKANLIAPNKRPFSSMSPTILLDLQRKFYMTLGTPGGSTIPTQLLQAIQNIIDFKMDIQKAIDAPRYHMQWRPDVLFLESTSLSRAVLDKLAKKGYQFKQGSPWGTRQWGVVTAIVKDPKNGWLIGAIDQRSSLGLALGVSVVKKDTS